MKKQNSSQNTSSTLPSPTQQRQKHEQTILSLLKRTLVVNWKDDKEIQQKMEKLSHLLAEGVWRRDLRHRA